MTLGVNMGWRQRCLFAFVSVFFLVTAQGAYEGYMLYRVQPATMEHVEFLHQLTNELIGLDFWQPPTTESKGTVLAPPQLISALEAKLNDKGIAFEVADVDVMRLVASSEADSSAVLKSPQRLSASGHSHYRSYDQILGFLDGLKDKYANHITLYYLANQTYEGKDVACVKLQGSKGSNKPVIIMEAGIHAREWISPASTLYFAEKLLSDYKSNPEMLDKYDWYIVPVTNPDGYEYSRNNDRLWRKNRRRNSRNGCRGVDLNRNFDFHHFTTGVSSYTCSDVYPGVRGFSEFETANIKYLFNELKSRVVSYVSVHSYSQFILVPWGHDRYSPRPSHHVELDRVANKMSSAIRSFSGRNYRVGTPFQLLQYEASGSSQDWALNQKPGIYAYCYELRPDGNAYNGFMLPASEIVPTGKELHASLKVMVDEMRHN